MIKNTEQRFGYPAIFFHWIMAILVIGMICIGLYMARLTFSPEKLKLIGWHKQTGILILMLAILRVSWRLTNITPAIPAHYPAWQHMAARLSHFLLYCFLFLMPLSGWLMSSAAGVSVSFFGLFTMPNLIDAHAGWAPVIKMIHRYFAYTLIGLISIHVLAALQHHFIYRDHILRRMLP